MHSTALAASIDEEDSTEDESQNSWGHISEIDFTHRDNVLEGGEIWDEVHGFSKELHTRFQFSPQAIREALMTDEEISQSNSQQEDVSPPSLYKSVKDGYSQGITSTMKLESARTSNERRLRHALS